MESTHFFLFSFLFHFESLRVWGSLQGVRVDRLSLRLGKGKEKEEEREKDLFFDDEVEV